MMPPFGYCEVLCMKVINEKDYVYVERQGQYHVFETNPKKVDFDKEILMVLRARYVKENGKCQFFDYLPEKATVG
jgi:hypothetical protein